MKKLKMMVITLALTPILVFAQEFSVKAPDDESVKVFQDWSAQCETEPDSGKEICYSSQSILLKENNAEILYVAVGYVPGSEQPLLRLTTPLGTLLPEGMSLRIDSGEATRLPYIFCNRIGCHIEVTVTDKFLNSAKKGSKIHVKFVDLGKRDIEIPVSLSGFTKAFEFIKK